MAILTKYNVRNTRGNSEQVRIGVCTTREVMYMFRNKAYQIVGIN